MSSVRTRATVLALVVVAGAVLSSARAVGGATGPLVARFDGIVGGPSRAVIEAARVAYERALGLGVVTNPRVLTVIDYTLPSITPRLWVLDLASGAVVHRELVAHGRGSGDSLATSFSNQVGSHKSSLGLFVTDIAYVGHNGYSLRLRGLDAGINDRAYAREIVIHGAGYVSDAFARALGQLGRSWGCPAVRPEIARTLIDEIKGGSVLYAYGPASELRPSR
jgi:hypothetical protein